MVKTRSKEPLLTVVVPLYNEELTLPGVLPPLISYCRSHHWKLLLVNDGSTDGTRQILSAYENKSGVQIVHHKVNRGYGGALKQVSLKPIPLISSPLMATASTIRRILKGSSPSPWRRMPTWW